MNIPKGSFILVPDTIKLNQSIKFQPPVSLNQTGPHIPIQNQNTPVQSHQNTSTSSAQPPVPPIQQNTIIQTQTNFNDNIDTHPSTFQSLKVWQKSVDLSVEIYGLTKSFPVDERENGGLAHQLRRAAVGIPSNIAEGYARDRKEYAQFCSISLGSLFEVQTQLIISQRIGYITQVQCDLITNQINEISRMLKGLITSIKRMIEDNDDNSNSKKRKLDN